MLKSKWELVLEKAGPRCSLQPEGCQQRTLSAEGQGVDELQGGKENHGGLDLPELVRPAWCWVETRGPTLPGM